MILVVCYKPIICRIIFCATNNSLGSGSDTLAILGQRFTCMGTLYQADRCVYDSVASGTAYVKTCQRIANEPWTRGELHYNDLSESNKLYLVFQK